MILFTHGKIIVTVGGERLEGGRSSFGILQGIETTDADRAAGLHGRESGAHELGAGVIRKATHKHILLFVIGASVQLEVRWRGREIMVTLGFHTLIHLHLLFCLPGLDRSSNWM